MFQLFDLILHRGATAAHRDFGGLCGMLFKRGRFLTRHIANAEAPQPRLKQRRGRNRRSSNGRRQNYACLVEHLENRLYLSAAPPVITAPGTQGGAEEITVNDL